MDFCEVEILVKETESSKTTEKAKYGSCYQADSLDSGEEGSLAQGGIYELILGFHCSPADMRLSELDRMSRFSEKNMSETLQSFHFREVFLDGKCIDVAKYIDGRLSGFSCEP